MFLALASNGFFGHQSLHIVRPPSSLVASSIYIYLARVHRSCSHNPIQDGVGFLLPHFLPRLSNGQPPLAALLGLWPPNRGQTLNTLVIEMKSMFFPIGFLGVSIVASVTKKSPSNWLLWKCSRLFLSLICCAKMAIFCYLSALEIDGRRQRQRWIGAFWPDNWLSHRLESLKNTVDLKRNESDAQMSGFESGNNRVFSKMGCYIPKCIGCSKKCACFLCCLERRNERTKKALPRYIW